MLKLGAMLFFLPLVLGQSDAKGAELDHISWRLIAFKNAPATELDVVATMRPYSLKVSHPCHYVLFSVTNDSGSVRVALTGNRGGRLSGNCPETTPTIADIEMGFAQVRS